MARYVERVTKKTFEGEQWKKTYMDACKWLASYVVSKDELNRNVFYRIQKNTLKRWPTVDVYIYAEIDEKEVYAEHCQICKDTHKSFFINEETNCNWCKIKAFERRLKRILENKIRFVRGLM